MDDLLKDVEFTRWTRHTIADRPSLLGHLNLVRERGYDICNDEIDDHEWAIAAPVRDQSGRTRAALTVVAPLPSVGGPARRLDLQHATLKAAREVSAELGWDAAFGEGESFRSLAGSHPP